MKGRRAPRCASAVAIALAIGPWLGSPAHARVPERTLTVFAAASLTESFHEIAEVFERTHGVVVRFNLAGSQQLASQIEQGAPADVFASADERWMVDVRSHAMLAEDPVVFAHNQLVVIVPRTNPARIGRLQDLARRGVKLVVGAPAVPVGAYGREMLQKLASQSGFSPDYARRVLANVVSEEENVKSVVGKVQLGEADAGIVYRSDVTAAVSRLVRTFAVSDSANVVTSDWIAVLRGARESDLARDFVAFILSAESQSILARRGFTVAAPATR